MLDLQGGDNVLVYDGFNNPNVKSLDQQHLTPGNSYGFSVLAFNFNGAGKVSPIAVFTACIAPSGLAVPQVLMTTKSTISFRWTPPEDEGACPVLSYQLELDDGLGGAFAAVDTAAIEKRAYLREHTVVFSIEEEFGRDYRFRLRANNEIGEVYSAIGSQLMA
jgi:hypothetical protein